MRHRFRLQAVLLAAFAGFLAGCGGSSSDIDLEAVSGTVTLDGKPLPDARVIFTPEGGGRPGMAITDEDGEYTVEYTTTGSGTPPGDYIVAIRTHRAPEEDPDTGEMSEEVPERVPDAYHSPSTLKVTVPGGSYDFALESSAGEVVQPETDPTGEQE